MCLVAAENTHGLLAIASSVRVNAIASVALILTIKSPMHMSIKATPGTTGGNIPNKVILATPDEEGCPIIIGLPNQLLTPCDQIIRL